MFVCLFSGIIGSGLCVFSRHPIMAAYTHRFSVCGSMKYFLDGELFAGKGILMCRVLTPSGPLAFYNTHVSRCVDPLPNCVLYFIIPYYGLME